MNSHTNNPTRVKLLATVIGGSAIVAVGALGVALNVETSTDVVSDPSTPVVPFPTPETSVTDVPSTEATTAVTTSATTPPSTPPTSKAAPSITTTPTSAEPG